MSLQALQTDLLNLVKNRLDETATTDAYLLQVAESSNLLLARKIINWWRKIQIQNYCGLTGNLLNANGMLDEMISEFSNQKFSVFRENAGMQFLDFISTRKTDALIQSVSQFEQALLELRKGNAIKKVISWPYEPFSVIHSLLNNTFSQCDLQPGNFEIIVSDSCGSNLFEVFEMTG